MFKLFRSIIILILIIQHPRAKRDAAAPLKLSLHKSLSFPNAGCPSSEAGTEETAALYCMQSPILLQLSALGFS